MPHSDPPNQPATTPTLAILICTVDRPEGLRRCLASIAAGTAQPAEILVLTIRFVPGLTTTHLPPPRGATTDRRRFTLRERARMRRGIFGVAREFTSPTTS